MCDNIYTDFMFVILRFLLTQKRIPMLDFSSIRILLNLMYLLSVICISPKGVYLNDHAFEVPFL